MRPLALALVLLLLAGCSSPPAQKEPAAPAASPPAPVEIAHQSNSIGLPGSGPVSTSAGVGLRVPANATSLLVKLTVTLGASVGLRASGVAGCEHAFPSPAKAGDAFGYTCTSPAGKQTLRITQDAGNVAFDVSVVAGPAA